MGKITLKELLCGANSDAQFMFEKAKSKRYSVNIHHMERALQKKNIFLRSFLLSMMGENSVLYDQNPLSETGDTGEHFCSLRYHKHRDKKSQNFSLNEKRNHYLQKLLEELSLSLRACISKKFIFQTNHPASLVNGISWNTVLPPTVWKTPTH